MAVRDKYWFRRFASLFPNIYSSGEYIFAEGLGYSLMTVQNLKGLRRMVGGFSPYEFVAVLYPGERGGDDPEHSRVVFFVHADVGSHVFMRNTCLVPSREDVRRAIESRENAMSRDLWIRLARLEFEVNLLKRSVEELRKKIEGK